MVCDVVAFCAAAVVVAVTLRNVACDVARSVVGSVAVADSDADVLLLCVTTSRQSVVNDGRMSAVDDAVGSALMMCRNDCGDICNGRDKK